MGKPALKAELAIILVDVKEERERGSLEAGTAANRFSVPCGTRFPLAVTRVRDMEVSTTLLSDTHRGRQTGRQTARQR